MPIPKLSTEILNAAVEGLEAQKRKIEANIAEIRQMLRGNTKPVTVATAAVAPKPAKRTMSAAGRAAIAEAQRKRWAARKKAAK
jgi:hypothetical protein